MSQSSSKFLRLRKEITRAWAIGWKDIKVYYLSPPTLMFGVMFPFALFFTFTVGRNLTIAQMMPVLFSQTVFWAASTVGPVVIPLERRTKTFDRYLSSPMSLSSVILGKSFAGVVFGLLVSIVPLIVGWVFFSLQIVDFLMFALGVLLSCMAFATMGIMFASVPTESVGNIMMPMNFVRIPLLFISGIFIPIETLPFWGQIASLFSPLTHTLILIRLGLGISTYPVDPIISVVVLLFTTFIFFMISRQFHEINKRRE
ncbi:MAG: ABC transporter permease [Candidatus Thorarchaeota archaeon]|nr:ABC transporter permease [Candidatus Thorarchaeota archaeon]